jgi:hypothetical protein
MRRLEPGRMRPGYGTHMCVPDSGTCAAVNYIHIREHSVSVIDPCAPPR